MSTIFNPLMALQGKQETVSNSSSRNQKQQPPRKTARLLPKPDTLFNPLDALPQQSLSNSLDLESTSAIHNMTIGTCPKCQTPMGRGILANSDAVYFCHSCAVSTPIQDAGNSQPQVQPTFTP